MMNNAWSSNNISDVTNNTLEYLNIGESFENSF